MFGASSASPHNLIFHVTKHSLKSKTNFAKEQGRGMELRVNVKSAINYFLFS
jgi:hypothetical protein